MPKIRKKIILFNQHLVFKPLCDRTKKRKISKFQIDEIIFIARTKLQFLKKAMLQYYLKKSLVFLKKICCLFNNHTKIEK